MIDGRKRTDGFSLVELLIAFFVLLVGILAVLTLFPLGLRESMTMVESSTSAFAARNARNLMEVHPFTYSGNRQGNGTASMVQILYGPRGTRGNIFVGAFPVMFPADILGNNEDSTFPRAQRPVDPNTGTRDRVVDFSDSRYSWDARFTVGGGQGLTLPPGGRPDPNNPNVTIPWTWDDVDYWRTQYFNYYGVQISIYHNYEEITIGSGTIYLKPSKKPGGGDYDANDPNRPLYSELVLTSQPNLDLTVDSAIRVRDDKSDWYRITAVKVETSPNTWTFRLDRPYAKLVSQLGQMMEVSAARNDIIGTNSLTGSFTTLLGSQLEETDTSGLDTINWPPGS